jgi:hypothetical protein
MFEMHQQNSLFEQIKQIDEKGNKYWSAETYLRF